MGFLELVLKVLQTLVRVLTLVRMGLEVMLFRLTFFYRLVSD